MQDRYVGDVGDFAKYGLLRAIQDRKRLGMAWYLHPDEGPGGDGGHVEYLSRPEEFEELDPALFAAMRSLRGTGQRPSVHDVAESRILWNAVFADEPLDIRDVRVPDRPRWRQQWFERVERQLSDCEMVFVDPDNGLVSDADFKPGRKESAKRLPVREAICLAGQGRTVVIYHHNSRSRQHRKEIDWWMSQLPGCAYAYYWKRWSCRTFLVVNPDPATEQRLINFAHEWRACGELIPRTPSVEFRSMLSREWDRLEQLQDLLQQSDVTAAIVGAEILFSNDLQSALLNAISTLCGTADKKILKQSARSLEAKINLGLLLGLYEHTTRDGLNAIGSIRNAFAHISDHRVPRFHDPAFRTDWEKLPVSTPSRDSFLKSIDEFRALLDLSALNYQQLLRLRQDCALASAEDIRPYVECTSPGNNGMPASYHIGTPGYGSVSPEAALTYPECYQIIRCFNGQSPDEVRKLLEDAEKKRGQRLGLSIRANDTSPGGHAQQAT